MATERDDELAEVFADIARQLQAERSPEKTQEAISRAAVDTIAGCDHAAISLIRRCGGVETKGATDEVPGRVDAIQYEVDQGPCLETIEEHETYLISDLCSDERWPLFSHRAARETGVRSMLSFRLFVESDTIGALNLYSRDADAFDQDARAVGSILAAHAAIAVTAARDRERADQLDRALQSNREIGMAMGVLMARGCMAQDQAFDLLRRASQHLNVKLRDVAAEVVETGQLPERPIAN